MDSHSDYIEREPLRNTLASTVIPAVKINFARIPDEYITDNGPQFARRMLAFLWQVRVYQGQGNGKAESAFRISRNILKKSRHEDP